MSSHREPRLLTALERLPIISRMPLEPRRGAAIGMLVASLVLVCLGGWLGYLNRAELGAVAGAGSGLILGLLLGAMLGALSGAILPPRRARAEVIIETNASPGGRCSPGDVISGYVRVTPENSFGATSGKVYLVCQGFACHETNDGDQGVVLDREMIDLHVSQCEFEPLARMRQGVSSRYPFKLTIPEPAQPTHHGYVCGIQWTLHALIETSTREPIAGQQEMMVLSTPPVFSSHGRGYQSASESPHCHLTLTLPQAVIAEGQSIEANLRIAALETFVANEVRAVLLRIENTPVGQDHTVYVGNWDSDLAQFNGERLPGGRGTTYVWLEDEVTLAQDLRLEIAESTTLSFKLNVPAQWRPTIALDEGTVRWKLGIAVGSSRYPQARVFHEVIIYTGMAEIMPLLRPDPIPLIRRT